MFYQGCNESWTKDLVCPSMMILWSCSSRSWNNWVFTSEFPVSLGNDGSFCTDYILKIGKCEMGLDFEMCGDETDVALASMI